MPTPCHRQRRGWRNQQRLPDPERHANIIATSMAPEALDAACPPCAASVAQHHVGARTARSSRGVDSRRLRHQRVGQNHARHRSAGRDVAPAATDRREQDHSQELDRPHRRQRLPRDHSRVQFIAASVAAMATISQRSCLDAARR
jgi:hypothetical protein